MLGGVLEEVLVEVLELKNGGANEAESEAESESSCKTVREGPGSPTSSLPLTQRV